MQPVDWGPAMELRQLEYFVTVAEEGNFTRAAERLFVTQPGVSAQIRQLEHEFGQPLLDRSTRRVRLTAVGEVVLPYARAALAAIADARAAADQFTGLTRGRVAIGMVGALSFDITGLLSDFHKRYPQVEISLTEAMPDRLLEALREGALDLATVAPGRVPPPDLEMIVVADEPIVAAVREDHPLARRQSLAIEALQGHRIISLPRGTGIRACIEEACTNAGIRLHFAFEASNLTTLAQLASRGLGVALLPEVFAGRHAAKLRRLAIVRPPLRGRLALAWRAGQIASPAARALIEHARAALPPLRRRGGQT
jgi:DNA-binding transcriptional LysR family regulator